jgi:CHAT domain-containing protein
VFDAADPRVTRAPDAGRCRRDRDRTGLEARDFADVSGLRGQDFGRLLASRSEALRIAALVPDADLALDFAADRERLAAPNLSAYRLLHLASHGYLDDAQPELSGLVLSLVAPDGTARDGFVPVQDVYRLRLSADLVVLSACRTGLGRELAGEGLIGLVRAFMYAGARRVVASLWKVDDEATGELMVRFYRGMFERHLAPAAALREAQLEIRAIPRWSHPFYWAGFVLYGDWAE